MHCLWVSGDIALRILNHAKDKYADRKIHVQMLDINPEMLEEGKKRFARTMYHDGGLALFGLLCIHV
jgi:2-methoxy-6-polyprenyl-1,4-benzoquinol methylase